jgi:hypothetical protein
MVSGRYLFHQRPRDPDPTTRDIKRHDMLLVLCRKVLAWTKCNGRLERALQIFARGMKEDLAEPTRSR